MKIFAADWVLPISDAPIERGAIAVENDIIVAVGRKDKIAKQFPCISVEDFGEAAILPGFVNCHAHLELTAMRGFLDSVEHDFFAWLQKLTLARAELTTEDLLTSSVCGAIEAVRAGVTTIGDIATNADLSLRALRETGLRGVSFQETISFDSNFASEKTHQLREQVASARELETAISKIGVSPHAPYSVSPRLFEFVTDFALIENLPVSIHAAESQIEEDLLLNGSGFFSKLYAERNLIWNVPQASSVKYLHKIGALESKPLLAHCVRVDDADLDIIAETGSKIAHCPKSNAKFAHGIAPFAKFLDRNVTVGLGSDSVASNNTCDILEEARFAALLQRTGGDFVSAEAVLKAATLGGARALGIEQITGSLTVGKQADFIVITLISPASQPVFEPFASIVFASSARDVVLTVIAGRTVFECGTAAQTEENDWRERLKTVAGKLRNRSGE